VASRKSKQSTGARAKRARRSGEGPGGKTSAGSGEDAGKRPRGRPRSAEADEAIFLATFELLATLGLHGLSMEAVADKAGVGKATLYRRYSSKRDLVEAALRTVRSNEPAPDTGSVRSDLAKLAKRELSAAKRIPNLERFAPQLLSDAAGDPELLAVAHETVLAADRGRIAEILRRGIERGELRADLDVEVATDLFHAPLIYQFLLSGRGVKAIRASYIEKMMRMLAEGMAAGSADSKR
jgi:AcrR family transcriptional regulator